MTHLLNFEPGHESWNEGQFWEQVPSRAGVFVLRGHGAAAEPYVSKAANLRRRLKRLLGAPDEAAPTGKRLNLRERVETVEFSEAGSDFESVLLLYQVLRRELPTRYRDRLKLAYAPLVRMHWENEYPRAYVTRRIGNLRGRDIYYGPFPSRAEAERFLNDSLDLFKLRRCTMQIDPDPAYPGCVYSEMKMCLAPCFAGCTAEQYAQEAARVQAYFDSGGESLRQELGGLREQASEALDFEGAAAHHARLEKVAAATAHLPEVVRRLDRLTGVIVQPASESSAVMLFPVHAGMLREPVLFPIEAFAAPGFTDTFAEVARPGKPQSRSMESRVQEALSAIAVQPPKSAVEIMEHLAMLKRWYYKSSRVGEIFLAEANGELPWRRIVRGIGRVARGEKLGIADDPQLAKEYWVMRSRDGA